MLKILDSDEKIVRIDTLDICTISFKYKSLKQSVNKNHHNLREGYILQKV